MISTPQWSFVYNHKQLHVGSFFEILELRKKSVQIKKIQLSNWKLRNYSLYIYSSLNDKYGEGVFKTHIFIKMKIQF